MRKLFVLLFAFTAQLFSIDQKALKHLNANNDHGLWTEQNIEKKFNKDWSVRLHFEQLVGNKYRTFYLQQYEFILQRNLLEFLCLAEDTNMKKFSVGLGYRLNNLISKNTRGNWHWLSSNSPLLEFQLGIEVCQWSIAQRIRGEIVTHTKDHYREYCEYRHRIVLNTPWKFTKWNINPYVYDEIFIRKNSYSKAHPKRLVGGLNQNRFRIGLNFDIIKDTLNSQIFWQWQATKNAPSPDPRWNYRYYYGITLNLFI